jgi:hypothetical protein
LGDGCPRSFLHNFGLNTRLIRKGKWRKVPALAGPLAVEPLKLIDFRQNRWHEAAPDQKNLPRGERRAN